MNTADIEKAKGLISEGFTFAGVCGEEVKTSVQRGVKPLLSLLDEGENLVGFSCADKVVGRGAAHLYVLLKPKYLYADVISTSALELLCENKIPVSYATVCDEIQNRAKTGRCPIETSTLTITDSAHALDVIRKTLANLQKPTS